jgi:hypothetical protein
MVFAVCRATGAPALQQAGSASCDGDGGVVGLCMRR